MSMAEDDAIWKDARVATTGARRDTGQAERMLDVAEQLAQTRGFNGFSYADIALELGVTNASVHYHFRSKAALGAALVDRYASRFSAALAVIDASGAAPLAKLDEYVALYRAVLAGERMCLCGILAAELHTLPPAMRAAILAFFDENERWLARVLGAGIEDGTVTITGRVADVAASILGSLEGAMLVARAHQDVSRFDLATSWLIASLAPPG
jgi:TetR/AcrR family transcriptional repressor of nem operon